MDGYLHLDCLRLCKALVGEVSLPDAEPRIDQYLTIGLLIAGRNCSQRNARQGARPNLGLRNVCLNRTSLCLKGTPDLVDVRITVTDVMSQAPSSRMESWRDTTLQRSILVVSFGPFSTLHSFSAGPVFDRAHHSHSRAVSCQRHPHFPRGTSVHPSQLQCWVGSDHAHHFHSRSATYPRLAH